MLPRRTKHFITVVLGTALVAGTSGQSVAADQAINLPLSSAVRQRVPCSAPGNPRGTIVMLPGGVCDLGIEPKIGGDIADWMDAHLNTNRTHDSAQQ